MDNRPAPSPANIYFPLIDLIASRYDASVQAINLTVTVYIIVQGIAPSFWSPISDTLGRRPVYVSIGASGIVSLSYASVADVVVHSERGAYLSPLLTITNLGPVVGPVIASALALKSGDPRWCFRTLAIFGGTSTLLIGLTMPETGRCIVGNGAVKGRGIWKTWWRLLAGRTENGFDILEVGLSFLPGGIGVITAGFVAGRLMDHNYKHVAKKAGFPIDRVRGDDVRRFPIQRARSRGILTIIVLSVGLIVGYGWAVEEKVHPAIPLVLQGFIGCRCATLHQTYGALVVNILPEKTGAAAASKNIVRCTLAGVFVAIPDLVVGKLGNGWTFTFFGLFEAVTCVIAVLCLQQWGMAWRMHDKSLRKSDNS
ncbi:major facilitator superfamily transporter [Xylariaceae sp. FL1272]|nr:major facilitator superfamily transporter [Xylariaceae sp. FL1272]